MKIQEERDRLAKSLEYERETNEQLKMQNNTLKNNIQTSDDVIEKAGRFEYISKQHEEETSHKKELLLLAQNQETMIIKLKSENSTLRKTVNQLEMKTSKESPQMIDYNIIDLQKFLLEKMSDLEYSEQEQHSLTSSRKM